MAKYEEHKFWCINCGQQTMPLWRKVGFQHSKNHRKKLYCYHCKVSINCVETRNFEEELKFKEDFEGGKFQEEAAQSLDFMRNACGG